MFGNIVKFGLVFAAGALLTDETKVQIRRTAKAVGDDLTRLAREKIADVKKFLEDEVFSNGQKPAAPTAPPASPQNPGAQA